MCKQLAVISRARKQLEQASSLDEVLNIRDKAEAVRSLMRATKEGLEAQNAAAELKLRAERKLGEALASMDKKKNQHAGDMMSPALEDIGVSKKQSSRWQKVASLPDENFDQLVVECREQEKELTQSAAIKLAKRIDATQSTPAPKRKRKRKSQPGVTDSLDALAGHKFGTIYADPPWKYGNQGTRAATDDHYQTMTVSQICEMPIAELAADDSHLHLWTTNAFLFDAREVMEAWGFTYKSCFVWVKPQMGIGNYWRVSHEFLLLGVRGNAKRFNVRNQKSWAEFDRRKHSAKPEQVRGLIEQVSSGPYLELFGRSRITGWTVFGNQVDAQENLL